MKSLKLKGEYIHLNQVLKLMGWAMTGGEANAMIDAELVKVNGNVETRRRNKIYSGFEVTFENETVSID